MKFKDLTDAYVAIHRLREFFDENAREINSAIQVGRDSMDPVAILHDQIQKRFYAAWSCYGFKPFVHNDQIVYWDHRKHKPCCTDVVESSGLPDSITAPEPLP